MSLFIKFVKEFVLTLPILLIFSGLCWALSAESVYPRLGQIETDLNVTVYGEGFDANTKLSMYLDSGNKSNIIGSATTDGSAAGVVVVGKTAYVTNWTTGTLELFDISNPSHPVFIDKVNTPGGYISGIFQGAFGVTVIDNIAYVADSGSGLQVIDVNPQNYDTTYLQIIGEYDTFWARDVKVQGGIAYVADSGAGLQVIDVSTPSDPQPIGTVPLSSGVAYEVSVQGNFAYLAASTGGLKVIDLTKLNGPEDPIVGEVDTPDYAFGVTVVGNIAYVADGNSGLQLVDVSIPSAPNIIGSKDTPGIAVKVIIQDGLAYIAGGSKDLWVVDINPASDTYLQIIGLVAVPGGAINVTVIGDIAYVADDSEGLQIIDIRNLSLPLVMGSTNTSGRAYGVDVIGDIAYVADGNGGLKVINVSTPSQPVITHEVAIDGFARDVTVVGGNNGIAYVACGSTEGPNGLQLVDLSKLDDPNPPPVVFVDTTGVARNVTVSGIYAYVAADLSGLQVINISSNPPAIIGSGYATTPHHASDVAVSGSIAYLTVYPYQLSVTDKSRLQILNVSDPYNPSPYSPSSSVETDYYAYGVKISGDGNIAYIADGGSGLMLVNVSNPSSPSIIGTVDTPGEARNVTVLGDTAYVADIYSGLQMIDVDQGSSTFLQITGSVDTPGYALDASVIGDIAYVANHTEGFVTIPVPVEIQIPQNTLTSTKFEAVLPSPPVIGNYTLRVFNTTSHDELVGSVTFTDEINLLSSKAIIVAGGGPDAGNQIWTETKAYANYAYDNLIYQGYRHEDIYYLTDQPNPLLENDRYDSQVVDQFANVEAATKANLQYAIETWAKGGGTSDLLIFMEDHGETEKFLMRGGASPQFVTADELDSWLDTLQSTLLGKVILVYDACNSGSFIARLTPPSGKKRFTLTSSTPDQVAYFLNTNHSFSSHFWSTFSGKSGDKAVMADALDHAATEMASYQTAQLDADGDGVPNQSSDYTELASHEGTIYALRRQFYYKDRTKPIIAYISDDQTSNGNSALLWARSVYDYDGDAIERVWAEVIAPDFNPDSTGQTVVNLPSISLTDPEFDGLYQATCPDDAANCPPGFSFDKRGTYIITYYAEDSSGIYSLPRTSLVRQYGGTLSIVPDQYENDDNLVGAKVIVVNDPSPQNHSFHTANDEDWVKFYGLQGVRYTIKTSQPTIISDPVIRVYGSNGTTLKAISDSAGPGMEESLIDWQCPADGLYYVRLTNSSGHYGANVRYKLKVYNPIAFSLPGYVKGKITSGGVGVAGAVIRAGNGTAITLADGSFILSLTPGSYSVSVSCNGYQSTSFSVSLNSGQYVNLSAKDINSIPRILNTPPSLIKANDLYSYTPVVVDADGDPLTFSITGKPPWASFSTSNGRLWGTPNAAHIGKYGPISIKVTDNAGANSSVLFSIEVTKGKGGALPGVFLLLQE